MATTPFDESNIKDSFGIYRGAGSDNFLGEMMEYKRRHSTCLIILVEPKVSGAKANEICRKLGKTHWSRSQAIRFTDGI